MMRPLYRVLGLSGMTAAIVAAAEVQQLWKPLSAEKRETYKRAWARGMLSLFNIRVHGPERMVLPRNQPTLLVCNHRSPIDIIVILERFGGAFLSRHDVERWPLVGRAANLAQTLFVERGSHSSRLSALLALTRRLSEGGVVSVFPEGTTFAGDEVHAFQRGAFSAAHRAGAMIVPIGLAYPVGTEFVGESFPTYFKRIGERPSMDVGLAVGSAFAAQAQAKTLALMCRERVQRLVQEARTRLDRGRNPRESKSL